MRRRSEPTENKRENQFTRISSIVILTAILVVAGGVSAITAMRFAIRGKEVTVPDVVGKSEDEARSLLDGDTLLLRVSNKSFSATIPVGKIMAQNPPPGTHLKTSRSVKVWLSLGDRKYAVPNLVGSSIRAAQLTLAKRNLVLGSATTTHTEKGAPSTVQQQWPQPGTQDSTDPKVNVLVSLGPLSEDYVMPDLIGRPAELVASRARAEGFHIGKFNYRKYSGVDSGVVIQQKPQAGSRVSQNDVILLEVSQ